MDSAADTDSTDAIIASLEASLRASAAPLQESAESTEQYEAFLNSLAAEPQALVPAPLDSPVAQSDGCGPQAPADAGGELDLDALLHLEASGDVDVEVPRSPIVRSPRRTAPELIHTPDAVAEEPVITERERVLTAAAISRAMGEKAVADIDSLLVTAKTGATAAQQHEVESANERAGFGEVDHSTAVEPEPEPEPKPELKPFRQPRPEPQTPPASTPGVAISTGRRRPTPPRRSARIPGGGTTSARVPAMSTAFHPDAGFKISTPRTAPPKLSAAAVAAIVASPTRRIQPSPPPALLVAAVASTSAKQGGASESCITSAEAAVETRKGGVRTQLFAARIVRPIGAAGAAENHQRFRIKGDAVEQLELELARLQKAAAEYAKKRQLQRDEGCVANAALRQAMQQDGLTGPEQQALAAAGVTDADLYRLLSDEDLWLRAGIDRPWRRRERRMEQHREHELAAETARLQAELEFQLRDALLVCDVLTPVLRQMSREASKATASVIYSIADLCALDLSTRQTGRHVSKTNDTPSWSLKVQREPLQHASVATPAAAALDHSLDADLNIMDHRLLCNLVEGTRIAILKAELPQLRAMTEGGLKLLANGNDAIWVHGDAKGVRGMSLKACRRLCLARQDEELLSAVIRERMHAATRLSAEPPLKGLSEGGCSMLAIAGVHSFADLLHMAYPPSEKGTESCTTTSRGSIATARLGSMLSRSDLKVLSRALVACGPLRFTRAAAEVEIGDMRAPLVLSAQREPPAGERLALPSPTPSFGLLGGTTATHNGDGNGWRSAICCDTPFDVFVGANARRGTTGHYAEFTILGGAVQDDTVKMMVGIARKGTDPTAAHDRDGGTHAGNRSPKDADPFMIRCQDGRLWRGSTSGGLHCRHHNSSTGRHGGATVRAAGFKVGDVIGLLVVTGTMTLYVNGERAGEVCSGVHGKMCWAVMLLQPGESVQIARGATLPKDPNHHQQQQLRTQSSGRPRTQQSQMRHRSPQRRPKRSPSRTPVVGERTARLGTEGPSGIKPR